MTNSIYVETDEDKAVKNRLWDATERQLDYYASEYALGHVVGERESEMQKDVVWAAKKAGYPMTLIRRLGSMSRRGVKKEANEAKAEYRFKIGLAI